jgi:hypothetical protein
VQLRGHDRLRFDNMAGVATVTTLSIAGVNGAFVSPDNIETDSPGRTTSRRRLS